MLYMLINNGIATYRELKYEYSMEEVLDLYDICLTSLYNAVEMAKGGENK